MPSLPSKHNLFLLLALVSLVMVHGVSFYSEHEAFSALRWRKHTHEALLAISAANERKDHTESLVHEYVLTGAEPLALRAEGNFVEIHQPLGRARQLLSDNPNQVRRLDQLDLKLKTLTDRWTQTLATRRAQGAEAASRLVADGTGRRLTDEAEDYLNEMVAEENHLLAGRNARAERFSTVSSVATPLCGVLTLLFGCFAWRALRIATAAIRASEESLAITLQSIGDGVLATDTAGRITRLNPVAGKLTGWPQAEAVGRPVAEVFHIINETTRQPALLPVADTLAKGTIHGLAKHTLLIARDGTERPIADSCAPIRNREGEVIGAVLVFRDVTQKREAELAMLASQRELESAVRANQLIMEHSLDVICTVDGQGRFAFVSAACAKLWGYQPEELVGRQYIDLVHPEDHSASNQAAAAIMAGRPVLNFENRYRRKDGTLIPMMWSASWSAADQRMFCVAHDLTERKQVEAVLQRAHQELRNANAELDRASRHKDEFLANMSHELRTPLNAILGMSELLTEQLFGPLTPRQAKSVTTISSSGQHLLALINDILDLSKIEAGKMELHAEPLNVDELCQSCLAFVRTQAMQKQVYVDYQGEQRPFALSADPKRFKQILVNLLTNAVKFTPGGGSIGLTVAAPEGEGVVCFTVWDTGIGIAAADQARLFRAFTQVDSGLNRSQEGTGLGLSLVAKLVELHGGSVVLESEPGKGSRFIVTLPLTSPGLLPPAPEPAVVTIETTHFRRALVIEDNPPAAEQLERYLGELDLSTVVHPRGEGVLETALRERPDVILLDIQLPNESGWVALAKLKEHPQTRNIPVAVVSVVDEPGKARAMGAATHLTKPVTRAQLAEFLQRPTSSKAKPVPPPVLAAPASGPTILLAEDNEANVATLGSYLTAKGYAMHFAMNGLIAVQLARELRPALILMDIQMPVMDGLTAIRELRADAAFKDVPIIALTALAMAGDRERCIAAGATDYMSKPVKLKELAELMERLLGKRDAEPESQLYLPRSHA